ncbi:MAG TPA: SOS response-associated peptidase [Pilimelia sp.]|nr:SOS response-associated peptidase [Pilimelia sp.]
MCGRYATTRSSADLSALFEAVIDIDGPLRPDYNVAPTDPVPIVRVSQRLGARAVSVARWGLVPSWVREGGRRTTRKMINARAETLAGSPAFGPSFAGRRCLVPADGWYEWVRRGPARQAYYLTAADGGPLVFAGLWTGSAPDRLTCAIVTTAAVGRLAAVHERMPLLLPRGRWAAWLAAPPGPQLLAPPPAEFVAAVELRPVGPAVGDVRNDGPQLTARVAAPPLDGPAPRQGMLF